MPLETAGFFVLRTPLLPFDELLQWSNSLGVTHDRRLNDDSVLRDGVWRHDVQLLRARLSQILARPEIVQALFFASPSLEFAIRYWTKDPESKRGLQAERSLVRYFSRMAARPTPFGLCAGVSFGLFADSTEHAGCEILLSPRTQYRFACRLSFQYLANLCVNLRFEPEIATHCRYWPNSSLHRTGDFWHYVESRIAESGDLTRHSVKLGHDKYLHAAIERAEPGATFDQLVETIQAIEHDAGNDATEYIDDLIRNDILVSNLSPPVTGVQPVEDLIAQLEAIPAAKSVADTLRCVHDDIVVLEREGLGVLPAKYLAIASTLESLPARVDTSKLFQVDMSKPLQQGLLPKLVAEELIVAAEILSRVGSIREFPELDRFRESFVARYERAWVPLVQALDEETGVGFGRVRPTDASPLLRNLEMHEKEVKKQPGLSDFHVLLLQKLTQRGAGCFDELALDVSSIKALPVSAFPDAFSLTAVLVARSMGAVKDGEFHLYIRDAIGPSGARLLARFCYGDWELHRNVQHYLRQEESLDPNAAYAEIVYEPEGKIANVVYRPVFRDYEITYLGRSGAPREQQIPITDLLVSVTGDGRIVLYSNRLKRRIVPRLTNAHNFDSQQYPPLYRFLCLLQHQGGQGIAMLNTGILSELQFLPRIRVGRVVLRAARWRLSTEDIADLDIRDRHKCFVEVQRLRIKYGMPRWILLTEEDNILPVDLDNALSVDAMAHVLKRSGRPLLRELYPSPEDLCVTGPEGRFCHELVVPFLRTGGTAVSDTSDDRRERNLLASTNVRSETRRFAPGSEWVYVKLYGGAATLDELLVTELPHLLRSVFSQGLIDRWFFLRYADPAEHLRIRLHCLDSVGSPTVSTIVSTVLNEALSRSVIWKFQLDTYEREIERYGGPEAVGLAEEIFFADSEAVLEILQSLNGDDGLDTRWRLALLGIDQIFSDCGLDTMTRHAVTRQLRETFHHNLAETTELNRALGDRFRLERKNLESLFLEPNEDDILSPGRAAFAQRSLRIRAAVGQLHSLEAAGQLTRPVKTLCASYCHMHVNRLIRSDHLAHERILYDFLLRLYESKIAKHELANK